MIKPETQEIYQVQINLIYKSKSEHFDFDSDMNPWTVARAMARYFK